MKTWKTKADIDDPSDYNDGIWHGLQIAYFTLNSCDYSPDRRVGASRDIPTACNPKPEFELTSLRPKSQEKVPLEEKQSHG